MVRPAPAALLLAALAAGSISPPDAWATNYVSVSITSPASGATVNGTITVMAEVDVIGTATVAGVQFFVDDVAVGDEDQSAPYAVPWDTTLVSDGSHRLEAVARDVTGMIRSSSAPVFVTTSNGASPDPDTTPPTVAIAAPSGGATVSGTIGIEATSSDDVGVTGVQFLLDGAPLGDEDTTAPYATAWDTTSVADGSHTLTAAARDAAGNTATSAPVSVTVSNAPPPAAGATRFENTDRSIVYTDGTPDVGRPEKWWYGSRSRGWSGLTSAFNRSAGARATFTFTGTSVRWIGFRAHWAGIARVSVDGEPFTEVDLFVPPDPNDRSNGEQSQAIVYSAAGLDPGTHVLVVESTGRKHGIEGCDPALDPANCASDYAVVVDAFDVAPPAPPPADGTRFEETVLTYAAAGDGTAWTQGDADRPWSGGTAARNGTAGARATFNFTGTSASWIGLCGPGQGIARVFLDGAFHAEVDTFCPTELQAVVFTVTGLAAASHALTIEATGLGNPAASGTLIAVDAFDVRSRFEDPDPSIAYSAGWTLEDAGKSWSGTSGNTGSGTAALSRTAGEQATFTFRGTSVAWIGYRGPLGGIAEVFVDGVFAARIDAYAPAEQLRAPLFTSAELPDGVHTLRIAVTGEKDPAAGAAFVIVDAFDVAFPPSSPPVTRLQEDDATIAYAETSDWTRGSRFRFDSSEVAMGSHGSDSVARAGATATLTFQGTSVRWIGRRGFSTGVAHVRLDGVLVATIDTRVPLTSQEDFQAALYRATGLAPEVAHTLQIELTGRHGELPGMPVEHPVWVDAFDVY